MAITANNNQSEVLAITCPECSTICRGESTKKSGYKMYELIILMILEFYGVEWKDDLISETSEILYDDYYWFTIAELKHFTLKCKSGSFGKLYGKFTPVTLIDWMGQYAEESLKLRQLNAEYAANDARYDERWQCHDDRKGQQSIDDATRGQMEIIKSHLKSKENEQKD